MVPIAMMCSVADAWEADVVLADGGSAHLRPVREADAAGLRALYESLSEESRYLRFFSPAPAALAASIGPHVELDDHHFALVAEHGDEIVGVADYFRKLDDVAEVAFTVRDDQHGRGLGSLLLDHLAQVAVDRGIRAFVAQVLAKNDAMRAVFRDAGFEVAWTRAELGVLQVTLDLAPAGSWTDAHLRREHVAEARSIRRVLSPGSIAVVGASDRPDSVGGAVLRNLRDGGFAGALYAVNPHAASVGGAAAFPSVAAIGGDVDLAVVAVPAAAVESVIHDCAQKGTHGLVVISSGFAELGDRDAQDALVALARRHDMRVVGPNCVGVLNTNPSVRMNATFAPVAPVPGRVGFASQSGGLGIELLARARTLGLGVSSFVSLGNRADVSSNDLLQYWEDDPDTGVILLYLESFGNPRKFARLARRVARVKPIVALKSGRTLAGARGAASHTAALANPDTAVDELFRQAGVVRVDTLDELFDTAALFVHQPLPRGRRVAIVSNGGGPGILAADACIAAGLDVPELSDGLQSMLRSVTPRGAGVRNPVDLVASAGADVYDAALRAILGSGEIDALLVLYVSPLVSDPEEIERAIVRAADAADAIPVAACFLGGAPSVGPRRGDGGGRPVPAFEFPESAARAVAHAARLAEWRRAPRASSSPALAVDAAGARALVREQVDGPDGDRWLDPSVAAAVLASYGVPVITSHRADTVDDAVAAAAELGYPVALKAGAPTLVHKSDVGGVHLGLGSDDELRRAFGAMRAALGERMGDAVVQPMAPRGVELIVGVTHDPVFGPLVLFGMGGVAAELLRDTTLRFVPLTVLDAHEMVRSLRSSPLLFGYRNTPPVDVGGVEELLLRIGRLAEDLPELAELDCNPVVASPSGALVLDVKLRIEPWDRTPGYAVDT
jgi:acetyl coenzyme A synthetase (ADP forming)-like protein